MFKFYSNKLIGYEQTRTVEFSQYGTDSYNDYLKNSANQNKDWIYHNSKVFYERNSVGHRSVEPNDLKKDFILFAGCSITEGIGVENSKIFPHLVAKHFNFDYYNLGLNGAGPDMVTHNIGTWLESIKLIPRAIVIQWPSPHRVFYTEQNDQVLPLGPWNCKPLTKDAISKKAWNAYEAMISTEFFEHYYNIFRSSLVTSLKIANIQVVEIFPDEIEILDHARDLKHPGIMSHKLLSNKIIERLTI